MCDVTLSSAAEVLDLVLDSDTLCLGDSATLDAAASGAPPFWESFSICHVWGSRKIPCFLPKKINVGSADGNERVTKQTPNTRNTILV